MYALLRRRSKYGAYCGHVPSKAQQPAQPQKRGSSQGVVVVVVMFLTDREVMPYVDGTDSGHQLQPNCEIETDHFDLCPDT